MERQIFINLAVKDVQKSMDFYTALGFTNNPQFSDDAGKCMVWSENIFVMLLTHKKFASFATKPIADTKSNLAALYSLAMDSLDEVNHLMERGLKVCDMTFNCYVSTFSKYGVTLLMFKVF